MLSILYSLVRQEFWLEGTAAEAVTSPFDDGWSHDFGGAKAIPLFRRRTAKLIKSICPLRHSSPHRKFMIWFTADDAEIDFEERLSTEPASSLQYSFKIANVISNVCL